MLEKKTLLGLLKSFGLLILGCLIGGVLSTVILLILFGYPISP